MNNELSNEFMDNLFEKKTFKKDNKNYIGQKLDKYKSDDFKNITPYKGFDENNPENGRQNNYAWSFCDFNGYIYVGTGRNVTYG